MPSCRVEQLMPRGFIYQHEAEIEAGSFTQENFLAKPLIGREFHLAALSKILAPIEGFTPQPYTPINRTAPQRYPKLGSPRR